VVDHITVPLLLTGRLQLGADGCGPDQAVAGGRRGMGLGPAADGEDGPLQLGRDALGDMTW